MSKLTLLAAAATGYVLGARAGRERYEQIASGARTVMRNPKVQSVKQQAQDVAAEKATVVKDAAAEKAKETASAVASTVSDKVRGNGSDGGAHAAEPTLTAESARTTS
jgi:hypothetical protein